MPDLKYRDILVRRRDCLDCGGTGKDDGQRCEFCAASGKVEVTKRVPLCPVCAQPMVRSSEQFWCCASAPLHGGLHNAADPWEFL
ncbi:MAG: hypothetical protein KGL39_07850 [Patescibacteria group bacterium]|nr:hypothetical protein [Patescibacteria group bacterium]